MIHRLPFAALLVVSSLVAPVAFAQEAATPPAPTGGPANLCQELLAFVKKPEEKKAEAATPASQATAVSNPSGKSEGQPTASVGQPQQNSGLSGPTNTDAKAPTADARVSAGADKTVVAQANAAAKVPPPPGAPAPSPKADEALIAKIEAASSANDQASCRATARGMRVAGFIMPPPLLALSALDLKFFASTQP